MEKRLYIIVGGDGRHAVVSSFGEALRKAAEFKPPVRIFKGVLVAELSEEELRDVVQVATRVESRAVGGGASVSESKAIAVVVFDQMFRGFGEVVKRELGDAVEVHEVAGRGLEKPMTISGVVLEPARDDYDVLKLLERLAEKGKPVIFFTGDKRLAQQASTVRGVYVEYMPPSELPGKEIAIKRMIARVREVVEEVWS